MKSFAEVVDALASWSGTLESVAWKSLILLALIFAATALWRRSAAAAHHSVWTATFLCLLALPVFVEWLPVLPTPAWVRSADLLNNLPDSVKFALGNFSQPLPARPEPVPQKQTGWPSQKLSVLPATAPAHVVNWSEFVMTVWLAGMMVILTRLLVSQIQLHRMRRGTHTCQAQEQLITFGNLLRAYRIKRPVELLISEASITPMTWGFWRPTIMLPAEACAWANERLDVVLRHELAHVKRWDCLTQEIAQVVCALYWFNPLVWLAARRMRAEREKACDDFVLEGGAPPSEYAKHLVEIARQFSTVANVGGGVAMARESGLHRRVVSILDGYRDRNRVAKMTVAGIVTAIFGLGLLIGGCTTVGSRKSWSQEHSMMSAQLKTFVAEKQVQESALFTVDEKAFPEYANEGLQVMRPDCQPFFAAAAKGDWLMVSNRWSEMEKHTFGLSPIKVTNGYPHGMWLEPVRETYGAIEAFAVGDVKYSRDFGDDIIHSIRPGSIYFGGTDPGRFIVTALERSQVKGDPLFVLTQNALVDNRYLKYLRSMYGDKIYIPTDKDLQKCFEDYVADARRRLKENKLKPGEHIEESQGNLHVSGQTAVMEINGLLARVIFDKNPDREFYIEESFPLDWMYPYLEPHGLIFKINRQPLPILSNELVQRDHDYWLKIVQPMIGDWLNEQTTVQAVAAFAQKVFLQHDFSGFTGDPQFVQNDYSCKMFSKERANVADLYVWRRDHAATAGEKERLASEADFAYRQAFALCPYSTETAKSYEDFLKGQNRLSDAELVLETVAHFPSELNSDTARHSERRAAATDSAVFQMRLVRDSLSADTERLTLVSPGRTDSQSQTRSEVLYVQKTVLLDKTAIQSARVSTNRFGPEIEVRFTASGQKRFAEITRENIGKRLAIIINGQVCSAPMIQSEIPGGTAEIQGSFSEQEAEALTGQINEAIAN